MMLLGHAKKMVEPKTFVCSMVLKLFRKTESVSSINDSWINKANNKLNMKYKYLQTQFELHANTR